MHTTPSPQGPASDAAGMAGHIPRGLPQPAAVPPAEPPKGVRAAAPPRLGPRHQSQLQTRQDAQGGGDER